MLKERNLCKNCLTNNLDIIREDETTIYLYCFYCDVSDEVYKKDIQLFKNWVVNYYNYSWHTLSDTILIEALNTYNELNNTNIQKFWN